jgi:hypothetical protein
VRIDEEISAAILEPMRSNIEAHLLGLGRA